MVRQAGSLNLSPSPSSTGRGAGFPPSLVGKGDRGLGPTSEERGVPSPFPRREGGQGVRFFLFLAVIWLFCTSIASAQQPEPPGSSQRKVERLDVERFGTLFLDARNNLQATDILARWREYTIQAQSVEGNLDRGDYLFQGRVTLEGGGLDAHGEMLRLNVRRRLWQMEGAGADLLPEFLKNQLRGTVRLSGQQLQGEQQQAQMQHGELTTCLLEHPHYYFSAGSVDVVVDKRLIARGVSLNALGRKLFTLPTLVVPLDRRLSRGTLPQVGQSVEEGYYVKTALGYLLGDNAGTARIDLMQKKGIGLGVDQQYLWKGAAGLLSLYYLNDRSRATRSVTAQLRHEQQLFGFNARLTGDLRSGSYLYYSDTRTSSWQVSLSRAWSSGNLSILSRLSQQSSAGYSSLILLQIHFGGTSAGVRAPRSPFLPTCRVFAPNRVEKCVRNRNSSLRRHP